MYGMKVARNGDTLTITVDLKGDTTPSSSGKTMMVASTEGNARIEGKGNWQFGLNVFTKDGAPGAAS